MIPTLEWTAEGVRLLDQPALPGTVRYVLCRDHHAVAAGIKDMVIRGAPAIGVAAAMGIALGVKVSRAQTLAELSPEFDAICETLRVTRPTAVNLFWAIARMRAVFAALAASGATPPSIDAIRQALEDEALRICADDIAINQALGRHGAALLPAEGRVLTHCNAGALATAGYGTALGVIRAAIAAGKKIDVFADETRPYLQGARLTAWELQQDNIPTTVITDNMTGHFLHAGEICAVIVGADRIAANGDVANKIGTYSVAVLAKENNVPFYVAAPVSTLDLSLASGAEIPIEQRGAAEVTHLQGVALTPEGVAVANPAFDVTPHRYVSAIITEHGVARAPYTESLARLAANSHAQPAPVAGSSRARA
ncbi:MAG TPA: S-methyl-5-thioribose-1-phosphate isomerase [Terriglobales bacterium]|nr:S-methyl-5-thioribose-1-phosphate isomerase [Terriglobales bacterium]